MQNLKKELKYRNGTFLGALSCTGLYAINCFAGARVGNSRLGDNNELSHDIEESIMEVSIKWHLLRKTLQKQCLTHGQSYHNLGNAQTATA